MTSQTLQKVDHSALKANQLFIIGFNILAFILNLPVLAAFVALVMGLGSAFKAPGFGFMYKSVLKPQGWMKPDVLDDNPEPHRFSQILGFVFMTDRIGCIVPWLDRSWLGAGLACCCSRIPECIWRVLRGLCHVLLAGSFECAWLW